MKKINIAELLKDCPKGMELYCTIFSDVTLYRIDTSPENEYPICIETKNGNFLDLTKYGTYSNVEEAKCVIFPKEKTTWEGFQRPFEDGDIVVTKTSNNFIFYSIYKGVENRKVLTYVDYYLDGNRLIFNDNLCSLCLVDEIVEQKLATEEEKAKLFDAIKSHGYKWNAYTKTLEKAIQPKFKVGDEIVKRNSISNSWIVSSVSSEYYGLKSSNGIEGIGVLSVSEQDNYEILPKTDKFDVTNFEPFMKVLVRHNKDNKWCASFFSHIDKDLHSNCYKFVTIAEKSYPMCIPYEGNEHLLDTSNNCIEYYKTWE